MALLRPVPTFLEIVFVDHTGLRKVRDRSSDPQNDPLKDKKGVVVEGGFKDKDRQTDRQTEAETDKICSSDKARP